MIFKKENTNALSPVIATLLTVVIVIILTLIVLLYVMNFQIPGYTPPDEIPTIFEIRKISSISPDYESKITLCNIGMTPYENSLLEADIYSDNVLLGCRIETMNGHDFIATHHFFVQTMGGMGCSNSYWNPNEKILLDLSNDLIKPGDTIRVDIIQKPDEKIISTDTYLVPS